MAGHMGAANVTVQNLKVVKTESDEGYIYVRGAVPGPKGSWVLLKDAVKKSARAWLKYTDNEQERVRNLNLRKESIS